MTLTDRQRHDLNGAVAQYLQSVAGSEDQSVVARVCELLGVEQSPELPPNLLQRRWTTILKLQKQVLDLERQLESAKKLLEQRCSGPVDRMAWVPATVNRVLKLHSQPVTSVAIHPHNPMLATAYADGAIALWNLLDLAEPIAINRAAHSRAVNSLCFSSEEISLSEEMGSEKRVVLASASSDMFIRIWDVQDKLTQLRSLVGHENTVSGVAFQGRELASCSRDTTIKLWDVPSGVCTFTFVGHSNWVRDIDICGDYVLSCSNDQSIRVSHAQSGTGIGLLLGHIQVVESARFVPKAANAYLDRIAVKVLRIDPNSALLANPAFQEVGYKYCVSGGRDNMIRIWLLPLPMFKPGTNEVSPSPEPDGVLIATLEGHSSWVRSIRFHPNGTVFASASDDGTVKFWDLARTRGSIDCVKVLKAHEQFVNCIAFAPAADSAEVTDSHIRCYFVSGGADNRTVLWK